MQPKRNKPTGLHGIGVDLVSRSRIRKFLQRHGLYLKDRFLNSAEKKTYPQLSVVSLAELFTAKEAFFKACGESWMGLEGFQGMHMTARDQDYFEMEWQPSTGRSYRGEKIGRAHV